MAIVFIYHGTGREYSAIIGLSTACITAVQTADLSFKGNVGSLPET